MLEYKRFFLLKDLDLHFFRFACSYRNTITNCSIDIYVKNCFIFVSSNIISLAILILINKRYTSWPDNA